MNTYWIHTYIHAINTYTSKCKLTKLNNKIAEVISIRRRGDISWKFRILHPTLAPKNLSSNEFSGAPQANRNHQHMPLDKLTGGYRKRLSRFWTGTKTSRKCPKILFTKFLLRGPGQEDYYLDDGNLDRLYKSYTMRNNQGGAAKHWNRVSEEILWF